MEKVGPEVDRKILVRAIEAIFSTATIFLNKELVQQMKQNDKGYVPYKFIFQQEIFQKYLEDCGLKEELQERKEYFQELVRNSIKTHSQLLWANHQGVRLLRLLHS